MHIRKAVSEDIDQLATLGDQLLQLHKTFDQEYYHLTDNSREVFKKWLQVQINSPDIPFFVAYEEKTKIVVGFITGFLKSLYPWFTTRYVGHISYLVIDQTYQRKGIGKMLEKEILTWFTDKQVAYIEVYVDEMNNIGQIAWSKYQYGAFKKFLRKKINPAKNQSF